MVTQHILQSKLMSDLVHLQWILVENFISMFNTSECLAGPLRSQGNAGR